MLKEFLGEKVVEAGIHWGEIGLRVTMGLLHLVFVAALLFLALGRQEEESATTFLVVAFLVMAAFVGYQLIPVFRAVWLSPRIMIYKKGVSYQDRHGERAWAWQELSHFEIEKGFGTTIYGTYVWRHGLLVVYANDEIAFRIDRLLWNAPKIAQITANSIPPKPKLKMVEEPRSTVHPLL